MMHKSKAITLLTSLILLISFNISKAACPLSISNLSINTQTSKDKADIIRLQSILYTNNLYTGPITGYYGKLTETAINNLKRDNDLTTNGIVDQSTVNLICSNYSCPFKSLLEKNDEYPKQEIKFIQSFLRLLPNIYEEKLVTGFYGTKTENAVKRLQSYLNISDTGSIDIKTRQEFCNFFTTFDSTDVESSTSNTSSIFQTLCLPFPKQVNTGDQVLFISQILGGNSPYKYI
jgi:peptidoglycan hydrolase-like protein with peptidoglycan-binding domain